MKSPTDFIVRPYNNRRYDNIKNIGGMDFVTSVSQEDYKASNRLATVVETPINYDGPVGIGDTLLVHHNVFKFFYDMKGRQKSGRSFFKDDLFFIDHEQFFLYKKDSEWKAHGKYCFIKPVDAKESFIFKAGEEPLVGIIKYINKELESKGLKEGDTISFEPDSEYAFQVDGEKLYRMFTSNIKLKL